MGDRLLFDTGADLKTLIFNMHKFKVDVKKIDKVFLSHEHGDHVGGLRILEYLGKVKLFIPKSFSNTFKTTLSKYKNVEIKEVREAEEICDGIFTTGELGSFIKEQSLMIKTSNGITVVTGCSHPGLDEILKVASRLGRIYCVVGGFHGFSRLELLRGIRMVIPCHCTRYKKRILSLYPDSSIRCYAGLRISI
ncbi:MAG: MBL fold metallo-hydrolase [Candidatus Asgardarchaeia archaeon]